MSKELEALKRIDERNYLTEREHKEFREIVEQALKRLESTENVNPNEALECLEDLEDMIEYFTRLDYVEPVVRNEIHDKFKEIYWKRLPHLDTIKQVLIQAERDKNNVERFKNILSPQMLYKYLGLNVGKQVLDYVNSYVDDILKD